MQITCLRVGVTSGVTSFCTQGWGGDVPALHTLNIPLNFEYHKSVMGRKTFV